MEGGAAEAMEEGAADRNHSGEGAIPWGGGRVSAVASG